MKIDFEFSAIFGEFPAQIRKDERSVVVFGEERSNFEDAGQNLMVNNWTSLFGFQWFVDVFWLGFVGFKGGEVFSGGFWWWGWWIRMDFGGGVVVISGGFSGGFALVLVEVWGFVWVSGEVWLFCRILEGKREKTGDGR